MLTFAFVVVQVISFAAPEAPRAETSGSSFGRCAEFSKPALPARVEGRVVSRDRKPRPNVQVHATLPETGREYAAVSDRDGRFTVAGFDADVNVELDFRDATTAMMTWCSVRLTRRAPEANITVILDEPAGAFPDVGCEGLPSGSGVGVQFLSREEARHLFEPRAEPPPARLDLRARDVELVRWNEGGATVRLDANATEALRAFTAANLNRPTVIAIDGVSTTRGAPYTQAVIESGTLFVSEEALRGPLCKTLEAVPQARR